MKTGGEGVVLVAWTDTLKCMKSRGDTVDFLQAEIMGTTFQIACNASNQILLYVLVYKQIQSYIFFWIKGKKKVRKCMNGGGQAHPSLEYISGLIMIGCGPG